MPADDEDGVVPLDEDATVEEEEATLLEEGALEEPGGRPLDGADVAELVAAVLDETAAWLVDAHDEEDGAADEDGAGAEDANEAGPEVAVEELWVMTAAVHRASSHCSPLAQAGSHTRPHRLLDWHSLPPWQSVLAVHW